MPAEHRLIVVGTSAGGITALQHLVGALPKDLPAPVLIVLHVSPLSSSALPEILARAGMLAAMHPGHGERIETGKIYVAPPNCHMTVADSEVCLVFGPRENGHRPAIDPLFRSAAVAYGARVIGVVLTGTRDDGTSGLLAVKERGGTAVVQDPADAEFPDMPRNALAHVAADHVVPLDRLPGLLVSLCRSPATAKHGSEGITVSEPAPKPVFTCPECGGAVWESQEGSLLRFRCMVGHTLSLESMARAQGEDTEVALWAAVRSLKQNAHMLRRLASDFERRGDSRVTRSYRDRAGERDRHADVLEQLITTLRPEG